MTRDLDNDKRAAVPSSDADSGKASSLKTKRIDP